ncbi:MAG: serine/threonine protein kinase, partial [Sandaracinaceae bacterium]|nr:serine/threonine protein kinase [Sandaracinaceae bacterium]
MDHDAEPNPDEADRAPDRWIGRTIAGTFHIDALIGEGAMGRVYAGAHVERGERVALKLLHPHLGGDPRIAKRFHREAKAASRLSHPSSLHIIDFGADADGTLFIAMELLEGEDLQTIIDHDAPLSPARIAELMKQTLSALEEAHRVGIIHRDLKPENVVVIREGDVERVKVCDFGIAKIVESEGRSTAITKDGYVCGTPEYMAPEQARGDEIDARADVYSAGVVLYQLLCGRVPFKAENALGTITKHIMETPVPPRRVRPAWGIPRSLERIALTALAKRPNERFASARAMSQAIDEAMMALGDAAEHRLGEGPFSAPADLHDEPEDDAPAEAASTHDVIAKVVAPDDRRWMYAAALGLVALAGALVYSATMRAPAPAIAAPAAPAPPAP